MKRMRYISFTFDDGRRDNYLYAYPIMKKYGIRGTLFCTTGYIDGSWKKDESWHSAGEPIHVEELKELGDNGWELALHGDKHTTEVNDLKCASKKMEQWGFINRPIGFSMPNSNIAKEKLNAVIDTYLGSELLYIRAGRKIDTKSFSAKALFALYTYCHMQWAYNRFNNQNLTDIRNVDRKQIYSVVVRCKDDPEMIAKFVEQIPDNTCAVLMLHSILPEDNKYYGTDPWNWSTAQFSEFCSRINRMSNEGRIETVTLNKIADGSLI